MLVNIIADYLQIPAKNAQFLMALFMQEGGWKKAFNMRSQADLIEFIQMFSQLQWFQGHDRSKLPDNHTTHLNQDYFSFFEGMGLTQSVHYSLLNNQPDFSVVLGSSEEDILSRIESLKHDLLVGWLPKENLIFGLGSNRLLGCSVLELEQGSKRKLQVQNLDQTEMNMVTLLTHECLNSLAAQDSRFSTLSYQAINTTASTLKNSDSEYRVKTAETATSLKSAIGYRLQFMAKQKPIYVTVYSNQPYILRQQRDIQLTLGSNYIVTGVGGALKRENFDNNNKSMGEFLGEIARLININYRPDYLKRFDMALTTAEIEEINNLRHLSAI